MEADCPRIAAVPRVDLAPGAGPAHDAGLQVVDPVDRRHAAEAAVRAVVALQPRQLILTAAPHHGRPAAVTERHHERVQRLRAVAHVHARELTPVGLRLRRGRRLYPAVRPDRRPRVLRPHVTQQGPVRVLLLVLGDNQEPIELVDVRWPLRTLAVIQSRGDHVGLLRSDERLLPPSVPRTGRFATPVVADGALAHAQGPGDLAVVLALLGQDLDGHDFLPAQAGRS